MIKIKLNIVQKHYLINFCLCFWMLFSIFTMFYVQFKVDNLQDRADKINQAISDYEDEIKVLEVEWVYLTRPERLRNLAKKYLQNNSHIDSYQIKNMDKLEPYYLAKAERYDAKIAMNANQNQDSAIP